MKTLKEILVSLKSRTGMSDGRNKKGAYWLVLEKITLREFGGDGIGQSNCALEFNLLFRHYRSGELEAVLRYSSYHQNEGTNSCNEVRNNLLECYSVEEILEEIIKHDFEADGETIDSSEIVSSYGEKRLLEKLTKHGIPEYLAAPDDSHVRELQ